MSDKADVNLTGVKQSQGVWLVKVCPLKEYKIYQIQGSHNCFYMLTPGRSTKRLLQVSSGYDTQREDTLLFKHFYYVAF